MRGESEVEVDASVEVELSPVGLVEGEVGELAAPCSLLSSGVGLSDLSLNN